MELLTEMLELVKPGEEKTQLFAMLFLRRLPPQVRVLLTEDDHSDLRALAEKADRCAASLSRQTADSAAVAAVASPPVEESSSEDLAEGGVSAVFRGGNKGRGKGRGWHRDGGRGGSHGGQQQQQNDNDAPADMARLSSGLCRPHFFNGPKAYKCEPPCNWQGN